MVFSLAFIGIVTLLFWFGALYFAVTKPVPAFGGTYTEGVVGQPSYVNPLLSQTSEADADLSALIYGGLFSYDAEGRLQNNLAERFEISEDGKVYTVVLREDALWHDGEAVTAEDAVFTFNIVQDPAYKSPLRFDWAGVSVESRDERTVVFTLKKPYFGFLKSLTVGILPKHIWENIAPEKFSLADSNLSPVGSGPYRFTDFKKDSNGNILTYELRAFPEYFREVPHIAKVVFHFYDNDDEMTDAYNRKEILGMSNIATQQDIRLQDRKSTGVFELHQPRLFAAFFNPTKSVALAHREVRQALALGTDRDQIVREVLKGKGAAISSPFLLQMKGFEDADGPALFDKEGARAILENNGWVLQNGVREKNGAQLSFTLTAPDWPELVATAELLRQQWEELGARVNLNVLGVSDLQQNVLRPREYDALLFGEATSFDPDPYSFWHSSQKHDPGLNFAMFDNKAADEALSVAREMSDEGARIEQYKKFRGILEEEAPAVFLYTPFYLYVVNTTVRGMETQSINTPSDRLQGIARWYMETDRVRK